MRAALTTLPILCVTAALASCGGGGSDDPDVEPPARPFAAALASVGGGGEGASLGVGWVDQPRLSGLPVGERGRLEAALAPNATSVVDASAGLERRFGFDPRDARSLVSVGGSYAFGLRLEGVRGSRLERALVDAGGRLRPAEDGARFVDVGGYASVPPPLLALGVTGLGARDAFAPDRTVLAISDTARAALLGRGGRLIDQPVYAAAASCVGNVAAARLVPAKLLRSTELGFDLVALGVSAPPAGGPGSEVLCLLGGEPERADALAQELESALASSARDPVTGEPLARSISSAEVERIDLGEVPSVRARLELASGAPPGFVFEALARGGVVAYLGAGAPHPEGGPLSLEP